MGSEGAPQLSYQFLGRVASYSLVKQAYDKATSYYTGAKSHALVKSGLEFAEQGLVKVGNAPVVTSLGQYCQPLLSKADHFACQQLDKLDNNVIKPCEDISVAKVQAKGKQLVNDKLVDPVAATYSHVKILPLVLTNRALDFAESFVDYLVPEPELLSGEAHEEEREAKEEAEGPTRSQDTLVVPSFGLVRTRATKISVTVARRTRRRVVTRYTAAKTSARAQFARLQAQATQLLAGVLTYLNQYRQKPADVLRAVKLKFKRAPELAQYWTLEVQKWVQAKTGVSTTTVTNYIAHASETLLQLLNNLRQIVLARANKVTEKVKKQTKRTAQATKENEEQEDVLIPATGQSAATVNKQQQQEQEAVDDDGDESDDSEEESDAKETEDDKAKH